jgi:hypothetical protein
MDTPSPATVDSSLAASVRVTAICKQCHRDAPLDLATLARAGHGRVSLHNLPLKCAECGGRGHGIIVSGQHLAQPLGRLPREPGAN